MHATVLAPRATHKSESVVVKEVRSFYAVTIFTSNEWIYIQREINCIKRDLCNFFFNRNQGSWMQTIDYKTILLKFIYIT
jgi:hypothetical protein